MYILIKKLHFYLLPPFFRIFFIQCLKSTDIMMIRVFHINKKFISSFWISFCASLHIGRYVPVCTGHFIWTRIVTKRNFMPANEWFYLNLRDQKMMVYMRLKNYGKANTLEVKLWLLLKGEIFSQLTESVTCEGLLSILELVFVFMSSILAPMVGSSF